MATQWAQAGSRSARAVQLATESAPAGLAIGVPLEGVDSVMPVLKAPDGETFTGAGTLLAYVYAAGRWVRAPTADRDLSDLAGLLEGALEAWPVVSRAGYFIWIPNAVGLSGGTDVTTDYVCTLGSGRPTV